jgi:hypothetical protein
MRAALLIVLTVAFAAAKDPAWEPFTYLLGEWVGEGTGAPGEASGGSTFRLDLDGRILVRTNWADYPAAKDRPAFSHRDLMLLYREPAGGPFRAVYFDNEGHVIHYGVAPQGDAIEFLSDPAPAGPRYRMTYRRTGAQALTLKFEIAPPGKPEAFTTYIEAKARKKL